MKTSILARAAALISAATATFVLAHSLAIYGLPGDSAAQTKQVAVAGHGGGLADGGADRRVVLAMAGSPSSSSAGAVITR